MVTKRIVSSPFESGWISVCYYISSQWRQASIFSNYFVDSLLDASIFDCVEQDCMVS